MNLTRSSIATPCANCGASSRIIDQDQGATVCGAECAKVLSAAKWEQLLQDEEAPLEDVPLQARKRAAIWRGVSIE